MSPARDERRQAVLARLRAKLDEIDEQTRLPSEKPLRQAVAEQAHERLREMTRPCLDCGTWVGPNEDHRCDGER